MAGARGRDINLAKPISQRSRPGMPHRSISALSRISAARSTEGRARRRLADAVRLTPSPTAFLASASLGETELRPRFWPSPEMQLVARADLVREAAFEPPPFALALYWHRCCRPSSSFTMVPGRQVKPLRVA